MGTRAGAIVAVAMAATIVAVAALAPAMSDAVGGETPVTVTVGFEEPIFDFGISPTALSSTEPTAVGLKVNVENRSASDGGPPLREVTVGLDRSIAFEPRGVPVCAWAAGSEVQIDSTGRSECPRAVIGEGVVKVLVAFPEEAPILLSSHVRAYNGGERRGAQRFGFEAKLGRPIEGTLRLPVEVRRAGEGRIGSEMTIVFPEIAEGHAQVTDLTFELPKFDRGKETAGYVTARCVDGKLDATADAVFADGTDQSEKTVRACTPRR